MEKKGVENVTTDGIARQAELVARKNLPDVIQTKVIEDVNRVLTELANFDN